MILSLQIALFWAFNLLLELVFMILRPILRLSFKRISYRDALHPGRDSISGGVLFHAASLGEVNAIRSLVLALCTHIPCSRIAISTTTVAGLKAASGIHPDIKASLSVLDILSLRRAQLRNLSPSLICIVETEIWPNLLYCAKQQSIPVLFLNARLGLKSTRRLSLIKALIGFVGSSIVEIMAKSEEDAARFRLIFKAPVRQAGNLKFALKPPDYDVDKIRNNWGFNEQDLIVCAGSTRPGEEALLLRAYQDLRGLYPRLKLIIAPRHPQRIEEVKRVFATTDLVLHSQLEAQNMTRQILIIDTLGHLNEAYSICDLAIVGGSLYDFGGHNPLEPAYYGKPILIGPFHSACLESVRELNRAGAIIIASRDELTSSISDLLGDHERRMAMGTGAREVILQFQNSLTMHLEAILKWIN